MTWTVEITKTQDAEFPWKAAVVAASGQRQEVGEFLEEKEARSYAAMELHQVTAREKPELPQAA
jgi:hypothetical protein